MTHHGSYFHLQPAKNFAMIIEAERDHEPRVIWPDISFLPNVISFKVQSDVIDFVRLDTLYVNCMNGYGMKQKEGQTRHDA